MERLARQENRGLSRQHLCIWGLVFLLLGIISRSILQDGILDINSISNAQLQEKMNASEMVMAVVTVAIVLQALETCAIPVFAFLLIEGFLHTQARKKFFLTLLVVALVSEIPYNLAVGGVFLQMNSRNPAIAMMVCAVILYFFRRYEENTFANVLLKVFVGVAAWLWIKLLRVEHGEAFLFVLVVLWAARNKKSVRVLFSSGVAALCTLIHPYYIASALGALLLYFYKENEDAQEQEALALPFYGAYPAMLLAGALLTKFLFEELILLS